MKRLDPARIPRWVKALPVLAVAAMLVIAAVRALVEVARSDGAGAAGLVAVLLLPPALIAAFVGVIWWRGRRPPPTGRCGVCGYDRSGLPRSRACPECGSTPG